jgi:hypothetical protein
MSTFDDFDYVSDDDEEEDEDVIVPARLTNEAIKVLTIRLF